MQREKRRGRRERRRQSKETKMSGLYREEPVSWNIRVGGRVFQVRTEGCWENLEARSALMCKICMSAPCLGFPKPNTGEQSSASVRKDQTSVQAEPEAGTDDLPEEEDQRHDGNEKG